MKKILMLMLLASVVSFADSECAGGANETCYVSAEKGNPLICTATGYLCQLGVDVNPETNAMFFRLSSDPLCTNLFKSACMNTTLVDTHIVNGVETPISVPSPSTKFFLENDGVFSGPLSMTVGGSIAMSAYNSRDVVSVMYRKVSDIEHGGIRVLSISASK